MSNGDGQRTRLYVRDNRGRFAKVDGRKVQTVTAYQGLRRASVSGKFSKKKIKNLRKKPTVLFQNKTFSKATIKRDTRIQRFVFIDFNALGFDESQRTKDEGTNLYITRYTINFDGSFKQYRNIILSAFQFSQEINAIQLRWSLSFVAIFPDDSTQIFGVNSTYISTSFSRVSQEGQIREINQRYQDMIGLALGDYNVEIDGFTVNVYFLYDKS